MPPSQLLDRHSHLAAPHTPRGHQPAAQLLSLRLSHLNQVLGWLFMHLSGKPVPKSSPRFSDDTIIASLSAAGDAFATTEHNRLLLSVITGAAGGKLRRK